MCGIIGVVGSDDALSVLLEGLARLEYRGYDSAGLALNAQGTTYRARRATGTQSVDSLVSACADAPSHATSGIGHTRWATHGAPEEINAHPHVDCAGDIAVIHNGIIENHGVLRARLQADGHHFTSVTDTEVLAHLIEERRATGLDLTESLRQSLQEVEGAFAVAVMDAREPDTIVCARRVSPLIVGTARGETFLASDVPAIMDRADTFYAIDDDQIVRLTPAGVAACDLDGAPLRLRTLSVSGDRETAEKGGHPDFMTKEIEEQPEALRATLMDRWHDGVLHLDERRVAEEQLGDISRVVLVAAGTSFHAAQVARAALEQWARLPAEVEISSEYRYRDPVVEVGTLVVAVSQSGETIDTIQAAREAKARGAIVLAVTNIVDSSLAREADAVLYTRAGLEVSVASTKAFVAQVGVLLILALRLAQRRGQLSTSDVEALYKGLTHARHQVATALSRRADVARAVSLLGDARDFFFLGRGVGFATALEGALKLKEISYLHAEGYAGGELKHGPLALIEPGVVVVAILTDPRVHDKMLSNVAEVKARGATVIAVAADDDATADAVADYVWRVPATEPLFSPLVDVVPLQLFAYEMAVARGRNVDRPRNLAKTVTVE